MRTAIAPAEREAYLSREIDAWNALLAEIRALPCAHGDGVGDGFCSARLHRTANGLEAWLHCDGCQEPLRLLPAQSAEANAPARP